MKETKSSLDKIKNPKRTQVVIENLHLSELLDKSVVKTLREKFLEKYGDPVITSIQVVLVPKKEKDIKKQKTVETLTFEQPSPRHYKNKKVVISSSLGDILEVFLKK